jgi:small subunit ribosomal protein S8
VYARHDKIPFVYAGLGVSILSTSSGVMSDGEARRRKVGGEILCEVW